MGLFSRNDHFKPSGKHCYIGGGSEGLGLALACQLADRGAHVSIVSRSEAKLIKALAELETHRQSPGQNFAYYPCDLTSSEKAASTLQAACKHFGEAPDFIFACAGGSVPAFFVDTEPKEHWRCMEWNFMSALCTVHEGIKRMKEEGKKGKVIFTGSVLSMMGFAGFSTYSPSKYAIRGLADSLRNELILYGISVHLFLPASTLSPSFIDYEQKIKPELTKKIEGPDEPLTPELVAAKMIKAAFNQRLQPYPEAVVYPTDPTQVSASIGCAVHSGLTVAARGGGHSYGSYAIGNGSLVIDLGNFKSITVDSGGTALVGAGNKLGDIALELNANGVGLPHGTCPYVGVGGHASFGGFGLAGRRSGLLVDRITAFDVVLANGTAVTKLTRVDDPDLFWALAGAGPNYGIITSFYFTTFPVPSNVVIFAYNYVAGGISVEDAASFFSSYQAFGNASSPAELGMAFTVGPGGWIVLNGAYYGTEAEFHSVFDGFVASMPTGYGTAINSMSWIDGIAKGAGSQGLNSTSPEASDRDDFYAKSLMTPTSTFISEAAIHDFFNYVFTTSTSTSWFIEIALYGGAGSAINAVSLDDNSFAHRDKLLTFQMYASSPTSAPPFPDEGFTFLQGAYDSIVNPMSSVWGDDWGAYVNYVDPLLSADDVKTLYWRNQYTRLASLRGKYDSAATFLNPQSIIAS
ncbi:hypothetical protein P7C70_g5653, partial [Phenoliferia sp. Uapishka_3]